MFPQVHASLYIKLSGNLLPEASGCGLVASVHKERAFCFILASPGSSTLGALYQPKAFIAGSIQQQQSSS